MAIFEIKVRQWEKFNPRKDIKRHSWFAFSNRMLEDADFFDFTAYEFKAWIYILSQCSQQNSSEITLNSHHFERVCSIKLTDFISAIKKLNEIGCIEKPRTRTSRARTGGVRYIHTDIQDIHNITDTATDTRSPRESDFEQAYLNYPRKEGKSIGIKRLKNEVKTFDELEKFKEAISRYKDDCTRKRTEPKFIKQFSSFVSVWKDWLDPTAGNCEIETSNDDMFSLIKEAQK